MAIKPKQNIGETHITTITNTYPYPFIIINHKCVWLLSESQHEVETTVFRVRVSQWTGAGPFLYDSEKCSTF